MRFSFLESDALFYERNLLKRVHTTYVQTFCKNLLFDKYGLDMPPKLWKPCIIPYVPENESVINNTGYGNVFRRNQSSSVRSVRSLCDSWYVYSTELPSTSLTVLYFYKSLVPFLHAVRSQIGTPKK